MRAWQIVAVVGLVLAVGGCSRSDPIAERLLAGDYKGVAAEATGTEPAHRFALSVARYFLDDYEGMNGSREALLADPGARTEVVEWIGDHTGADTQGAMADFLRGVAAQIAGDDAAARGFYEAAAATDASEPRFSQCMATVDPEAVYHASIPEDRRLTYAGTFTLDRSVWVPKPGEFEVKGGAAVTALGPLAYEATFGDWERLGSNTPGTEVGWCGLLTTGTLLLPPRVLFDDLGDDILFTATSSYTEQPFDYFGRYRLVTLGEGDKYPMITVPYLLRGLQWATRGYLGEEVRVSPIDTYSFLQVAFFPIENPMNISLSVDNPDKGLDFTYKLNEVPGEFRFEELSLMYVETDDPEDSIAVHGVNGRLHWLENTTIGRKKVFDSTIWGPLRTSCVLPGETFDPCAADAMSDSAFVPLATWHEYPVDDMRRRAAEFAADIARRRTVRDFADRPVPPEIIDDCIRAAGTAPSGAHRQPWHFVVVTDPQVKSRIRVAAEAEEHEFYTRRAPKEWLDALAPLGTDSDKPFLETAPYLIAIFSRKYDLTADGRKTQNYYSPESVGIATGLLIAAIHHAGLVSLTHTPSPMGFLNEILSRPPNEKPFLVLVVGYPSADASVPDLQRKALDEIRSVV